jgi:hypothetical protein
VPLQASVRRGARLDGKTNASELLINIVNNNKPKALIGLSQNGKVVGCSRLG